MIEPFVDLVSDPAPIGTATTRAMKTHSDLSFGKEYWRACRVGRSALPARPANCAFGVRAGGTDRR